MRILQFVSTLAPGDGVGNDVVALDRVLREAGYDTQVYCEVVAGAFPPGFAENVRTLEPEKVEPGDVIIHHLAIGTPLNYRIAFYNCRIIVLYHNVTPPYFFEPYNSYAAIQCKRGIQGAEFLADKAEYAIADSEFNRNDLLEMGYSCPVDVVPILIPFEDYRKKPNDRILGRFKNEPGTNVVFTGRVAPNKCHQDIIRAFSLYKKLYDPDARLFLVGSFALLDAYAAQLVAYIEELDVHDVYFTGHIAFDEILAYYQLADVFLCQSEHEGFCIPLVEAMLFDVPIIAYASTAVPDTLGGSGILMDRKNPLETAGMIDYLMRHDDLRTQVVSTQRERLRDFEYEAIKKDFLGKLRRFLER